MMACIAAPALAEQLAAVGEDRVIADARLPQHGLHLRPDFIVAADILRLAAGLDSVPPCHALHVVPPQLRNSSRSVTPNSFAMALRSSSVMA